MKKSSVIAAGLFGVVSLFSGCSKDGDVNLFSVAQDIEFGRQLDSLVNADYAVVSRASAPAAYTYLENMMEEVLASDEILYRDEFEWKITIIDDDEMLNAFAAPGGYLYFYTGLMRFLDNDAQLAGVMAHEIAHADRRHSTESMTTQYGFSLLLSILLGDNSSKLAEIAAQLALGLGDLKFSRNHEYEADEFAVRYTWNSMYEANGVAGFFIKLGPNDGGTIPFLSTHPSPEDRIEKIDNLVMSLGNDFSGTTNESAYTSFKASLP
jgi:beta-barrel assembly-enhancing protease